MIAVWMAIAPLLLVMVVFIFETWLGLAPLKQKIPKGLLPPTTILMPAHNEAASIGPFLEQLRPSVVHPMQLLVVADNCSDDTATIARAKGVEVIERIDPQHIGKGYALAFGRDHLIGRSIDSVIVLDADCVIDQASLTALARYCVTHDRPVQARYTLRPDHVLPAKVQVSNFAFWLKNVVRQRGIHRLGGAAILTGTGMAFPWALFRELPLASGDIVEDLTLGIRLTRTRQAPCFLEAASVESVAASEHATLQQRTRWEHGFLATALSVALPALWEGIISGNRQICLLALHLTVPPLALLAMSTFAAMLALAGLGAATSQWTPFGVITLGGVFMFIGVALSWLIEGQPWLSGRNALKLPLYVIWKIPIYLDFLRKRQMAWVRTERNSDSRES